MSGPDEPDPRDVDLLAVPLAELFEAEADDAGFRRLLQAAMSGDDAGLSPEERAIVADFRAEQARWRADGLAVDVPSPGAPATAPIAPPSPADLVQPGGAPRSNRGRWWMPALALAAAAALAIIWWARAPERPELALKGAFDLHVTVARPGGLTPVQPGARLASGEALGLAYTTPVPGHLLVLAAGDDGIALLHPGPGEPTAVAAGVEAPLPAGATLAPVHGPTCEYVVGVFAESPIAVDAATAAVRAAVAAADEDACRLGPVELPGARVDALGIRR